MDDPLGDLLAHPGYVVLDGGLATELERRGADLRDPLWSAKLLLDDPATIAAVHDAYLRAGADVVTTASYQATFEGLARRGITGAAARAVFARAVALARDAVARWHAAHPTARRPLVAASLGPYGALLADGSEYRGDYGLGPRALADFHRPRLEALLAAGPDLVAFETVPCLAEAEGLALLLEPYPEARAWVSFSARDGATVSHGEPIERCVAVVAAVPAVVATGVNCTAPGHVASLLARARTATTKPLVAYPNRGEAWDARAGRWDAATRAAGPAAFAAAYRAAGARLLGGCCRTTPDDIRALAAALRGG